jgi:hypothetical protein
VVAGRRLGAILRRQEGDRAFRVLQEPQERRGVAEAEHAAAAQVGPEVAQLVRDQASGQLALAARVEGLQLAEPRSHAFPREPLGLQYTSAPLHLHPRAEPGDLAVLQIELLPLLSDNYAYLLLDTAEGTAGVVDPGRGRPGPVRPCASAAATGST